MSDDATQSVVIERTLDAPIELVWRMWTEGEHFAAWYGPEGATIPVAVIDATVGGGRFVCMEMDTPDGPMRMCLTGEHSLVDAPSRLVYTELPADEEGNALPPEQAGMPPGHPGTTEVTVALEGVGAKTHMVMTHAGIPAGSPGEMGWNMALDKLTRHLADG